ncbi:MAG: hypothetical protein HY075_11350, partial [Deltaproteobacteria bacterium]|nr:hypothetical protein [Deltaproteobacteria bacterium]
MACHAMPWGGGPRTLYGKQYGSRELGLGKYSSQELVDADLRAVAYYAAQKTASQSNGLALMEAAVTGNVPVITRENGSELRALLTYNMAPLSGTQVREALVRWQAPTSEGGGATHVTAGRFYVPFGLRTDEHRTYTRIQTNMTLNNYAMGVAASTEALGQLHADLAVVNDFQTGGAFVSRDIAFGTVLDVRWNPPTLPFLVGVSGNYQHSTAQTQPYASSAYGVLSLDRLGLPPKGSLSIERVDAYHWNNGVFNTGQVNPGLPAFFVPTTAPAFLARVVAAPSLGYYGLAKLDLTRTFTLVYKLDFLRLDRNDSLTDFWRHGAGFEWFPVANVIIQARYERALAPAVLGRDTSAATQDDGFLMVRL